MKTKKILFATALVASFASCTNDDIVEVQQGIANNANRPTVENVKLNFVGEDADSRLIYNGKYAWESTDKIGALFMSNPRTTTLADVEDKWRQAYEFVNYISTSYPFAYDTEEKVWGNDAKMLEGDYFFAHPWTDYDGERYFKHSLKHQEQTGVGSQTVAKSFADNQLFVGYSQIKKGTEAVDALTDVTMTPVLGGIQFRIINNGSKTYHINKIVVEGADVSTELTLDPTSGESEFNYANYVGNKLSDLYNADENYDRSVDIRSYVVPVDETAEVAQLNVRGTKAERAIAKGKTGYAVVMLNEVPEVTTTEDGRLNVTIFTDEGVISNIDLTTPVYEYEYDEYVLVDKAVTKIGYNVTNTISIKFKDEAITTLLEADIVDNEDLFHLIEWNAASDIKVYPTATLTGKNVELTKEMFDLLKSNKNVQLTINGDENLTLADGLPVDVLDYEGLVINTPVVVANEIELTEDTQDIDDMTIAEEGVVTIDEMGANIPASIVNEGNITIGSEAIVVFASLTNEEEGTVTIAAEADVKGDESIVNYGKIINNGYLEDVTNAADAVIELGKDAVLKALANAGTVNTADGSYIVGSNTGLINFVTGATLEVTGTGMVSAEAPATVAKDAYKDTNINTLTLKAGQTTTIADGQTGGITNIITAEGATLKVATGKSLELSNLIVKEKVTIMGTVKTAAMTIAKNVKVYNYGSVQVTTTWSNKGIVYNNGALYLPYGVEVGLYKYTAPEVGGAPADTSEADALYEAMVEWIDIVNENDKVLDGTYDYQVFNTYLTGYVDASRPKGLAYKTTYGADVTASEFTTALAAIKTANASTLKTALLANDVTLTYGSLHTSPNTIAKLYEETYKTDGVTVDKTAKTVAYDAFRANVITAADTDNTATGNSWLDVKASVKLAASVLSEAEVDAILAAKAPTAFIWVGCDLDLAIDVWKFYDGLVLTGQAKHDYTQGMTLNTPARFVEWAKVALNNTTIATKLAAAGVTIDTLAKFSFYTQGQYEACAN